RILAGLGLGDVPLDTPVGTLSGGQKTRLGLAALLLTDPNFLILDEPTNHLDVEALEWLTDWLLDFNGGGIVVCHDRGFLDDVADSIVALQDHTTQVF